jgi:predicted dehydrogenase
MKSATAENSGSPHRFVVVGLGGYGLVHIEAIRWLAAQRRATLVGVVALEIDREARPELAASLTRDGVRLFDSFEQFVGSGLTADILTVPVGIHMHVPLSIAAMQAGMNVYCEKPVAATVQEVDDLIKAQHNTGRTVAVGFQHITSHSIQKIKARIVDGRLGPVRRATLFCGWPRSAQYYTRNEWTGKLRVGPHWILDSPANNAHAHYLMNLLYLCGEERDRAGQPRQVRAELFRANPIESPDTVQLKIKLDNDTMVHCFFTHANAAPLGPSARLECENGKVYWETDSGTTIIRYRNGMTEAFDNLIDEKWRFWGFVDLVDALREDREPRCTPTLARAQTLAINLMHESCPAVSRISDEFVQVQEDWEMFPPNTRGMFHRVRKLDELLRIAIEEDVFLGELDVPWAKTQGSAWFSAKDYSSYPSVR